MPEEDYVWLPRPQLLDFDELATLVGAFTSLGVRKLRLTGGEPLLRRDLDRLVARLVEPGQLVDVALTTNGILLPEQAADLHRAGLGRLTISLDTLCSDRFEELTRRPELPRVLEGIRSARQAGFTGTKLNTVVMRGTNDDELVDLARFAGEEQLEARFIEYMDVGGATGWTSDKVVSAEEILERLGQHFGPLVPDEDADPSAPARRYRLPSGQRIGIISSTTAPFCGACDRSRITADGKWYLCLYSRLGIDLGAQLRSGRSSLELARSIEDVWRGRTDRGAEERLGMREERDPSASRSELREDPHLEMHTRGG